MIDIKQGDCLELMKNIPDESVDLIFCDPPYALGSEVIIKPDGKPDYKKAVDFMNKWDQPDGTFWEEWFYEAKRVLKHGGHCLMFGMDRQLWFNCYYANLSGFTQKQSLYWYFISNFPKASDLSKNLDKYFGAEREVVDIVSANIARPNSKNYDVSKYEANRDGETFGSIGKASACIKEITAPNTPLAKKYEGIKYSVAPLKQTNETIMVFQKPYKTGSCLHDVLAMEGGDDTITCGGVDIEGNRVGVSGGGNNGRNVDSNIYGKLGKTEKSDEVIGRFPAQTYIDSGASEIIDLQSGVLKSGGKKANQEQYNNKNRDVTGFVNTLGATKNEYTANSGGASRILHRCDFEAGDYDLYHYCPKVSKSERNEGLEGFEEKQKRTLGNGIGGVSQENTAKVFNDHPTVKPKALLSKILKLFKTPNNQVLLDPFMGSGSMGISAVETGFDYIGYELDPEYFQIAKTRIENAEKKHYEKLF
jgi:site-specific DNA-methyltransferase (adenine-specific)